MPGNEKSAEIRTKKVESFFDNRQGFWLAWVVVAAMFGNFFKKIEKVGDDVPITFFVGERLDYFAVVIPGDKTKRSGELSFQLLYAFGDAGFRVWSPAGL